MHIAPEMMKVTPVDQAEMKATRMKRRVYDILSKASQKSADRKVMVCSHSLLVWFTLHH